MSNEFPIPEKAEGLASRMYFYALPNREGNPGIDLVSPKDASRSYTIWRKEFEVLQLICQGKSNKEISLELGISYQVAKNYVVSLLRKLSLDENDRFVESRTMMISKLVTEGIIEFRPRINEMETPIGRISQEKLRKS